MKRYISIFSLILSFVLLGAVSCTSEPSVPNPDPTDEYNLNLTTRTSVDEVMNNMRLYTFYDGGSYDEMYKRQLLTKYEDGKLKATVETGDWHLAMISAPAGKSPIVPQGGIVMGSLPMYEYKHESDPLTGRTLNALEIFTAFPRSVKIQPDQTKTLTDVAVSRNMAKIEIVINKATANFTKPGTNHVVKLHDVPNKISYTGALMPDANNPSTLTSPLQSKIKFSDSQVYAGYLTSDTVKFIIPAHKGSDYLEANPTDVVGKKMSITVDIERMGGGGSRFTETKEIPVVALCNRILRVEISVNDGMEFTTTVLPWNEVTIPVEVGETYNNWIYVKKDATGSGQSWSDAMGSINTAIEKAAQLLDANYDVHGILVAGGSNVYQESGNTIISDDIRVFGGWAGTPTTELGPNDINGPYTSQHRDLKNSKVRLNVGGNYVAVNDGSVFDGFIIQGVTSGSNPAVVVNSGGAANALQIENISVGRSGLSVYGAASNILYTRNNTGLSVSGGGKLISATVAENQGSSTINGASIYNTVFWNSATNISGTNTIQYSAFVGEVGTIPTGDGNIHINTNNTAWFSTSITAPGPHFKLTSNSDRYEANHVRSPILGRASSILFNNHAGFPTGTGKDINGNTRYFVDPDDADKNLMDIGCYEEPENGLEGFRLRWLSETFYLTAKGGYEATFPLMIPNNEDSDMAISVTWEAEVLSSQTWSTYTGRTVAANSNEVVVGALHFKNQGQTPTGDNKGNARPWGEILIKTPSLGGYMPNATITIMQAPGNSADWVDGYVGSFHRNREIGARYISVPHTGAWEARIISGLEWIQVDGLGKNDGEDITDSDEGTTPSGGHYKKVKAVWGGIVKGTGNVKFRVGMKEKRTGAPRYGLILITRTDGTSMFFVRQGEDADYLYRSGQTRPNYGNRTNLVPFSPYNVTAPAGSANGRVLTQTTSEFVKYPSQLGHYFRWNRPEAYLVGAGSTVSGNYTSWNTSREICPQDYRHPTYQEYANTIYYNAATSYDISPTGENARLNVQWGAYADGFFDQVVTDPLPSINMQVSSGSNPTYTMSNMMVSSGATKASRGALMVSHYDYGSVFFPAGGTMNTSGNQVSSGMNKSNYVMYPTTNYYSSKSSAVTIHWCYIHIGMWCTNITSNAAPVRCVKP